MNKVFSTDSLRIHSIAWGIFLLKLTRNSWGLYRCCRAELSYSLHRCLPLAVSSRRPRIYNLRQRSCDADTSPCYAPLLTPLRAWPIRCPCPSTTSSTRTLHVRQTWRRMVHSTRDRCSPRLGVSLLVTCAVDAPTNSTRPITRSSLIDNSATEFGRDWKMLYHLKFNSHRRWQLFKSRMYFSFAYSRCTDAAAFNNLHCNTLKVKNV